MFVNRSIESAGAKGSKPSALIFLEEWMTSGKIRPTLSHLLQLLIKSELFRAADYVAINLLSGKITKFAFVISNPHQHRFHFVIDVEATPQRPSKGPAAKIDITLSHGDDVDEETLNGNYPKPSATINKDNIQSKPNPNKEILPGAPPMSEEDLIRFTSVNDTQLNNNAAPQPVLRTTGDHATRSDNYASQNQVAEVSDSHSIVLPNISGYFQNSTLHPLHNQANESMVESNNLHQSAQQVQPSQSNMQSELSHDILPNFSLLNTQSSDSSDSYNSSAYQVPNLSILNLHHRADGTQNSIDGQESSGNLPQLSALMNMNDTQSSTDLSA